MKYKNIVQGNFILRENRFIAQVDIKGKSETVHVKNTGRCKELLVPGAKVYLQGSKKKERKTKWDLVTVQKGERLINMDSQAPNTLVREWIDEGGIGSDISLIKPEYTYGSSRLDFYLERGEKRILIEVKGVTLEQDNWVMFPDAPSKRAIRHVEELCESLKHGYESYIIFVVQMDQVEYFSPNEAMHPDFAKSLRKAEKLGVHIQALTCKVEETQVKINGEIPVIL